MQNQMTIDYDDHAAGLYAQLVENLGTRTKACAAIGYTASNITMWEKNKTMPLVGFQSLCWAAQQIDIDGSAQKRPKLTSLELREAAEGLTRAGGNSNLACTLFLLSCEVV